MINLKFIHDSRELFDDRYELKSRLGGGGFSDVWLAFDTKSRTEVALKVYVQTADLDDDGLEMFRKEFSLVCNFNHSNILRPFSYEVTDNHPYLVLPYCPKGSSRQFVGKMTEEQMWHFIDNVASGLEYLHSYPSRPVIHQDIKPANILIDVTGQYLITDFGISTPLRDTINRNSVKRENGSGTIAYMAPERFENAKAAPIMANDIWSLGATLYELATGDVPFGDFGGMTQRQSHTPPKINNSYSDQLKSLIYSCLAENPWERPTAGALKAAVGSRIFIRKSPSKNRRRSIYKIAVPVLASMIIAAFVWTNIVERQEHKVSVADEMALQKMKDADRLVERNKCNLANRESVKKIDVDSLSDLVNIYNDALKVEGCSEDVYASIQSHMNQAIYELIEPACDTLEALVNYYASYGAESAADKYRSRFRKLDKLLTDTENMQILK